ncbi:MAG TPA: penicillin-binding protein 2 [Ramlibacter sp.]|nr:penicillin-binding protein 2 [Ramlibacter sp.]
MTELRNVEQDLSRFRGRVLAASALVLLCFILLAARLVYLQVVKHEELDEQAEANRTAIVPIVPNRGLILDRNGIVLATNYSAYTLEITPSRLTRPLEQTIDELSRVIDIQQRDRRRFKKLQEESKSVDSIPIRTKLTDEEVARFTVQRFRFPGVEIKARLFRNYPWGELASHAIGYIGRVNQKEKEQIEEWPEEDQANYRGTEYIGKLGVEQSYEKQLHGITGVEQVETSAGGRAVRKLASTPATPGNTVQLSIDIKLQKMIEDLYGDRRGALVAMDPKSGEILAFVSKPTFDPNLFVDGIDQENWAALNESIDKPLLNRALRGTYPPGSTYKPFMALAALETGKRTASQVVHDGGTFVFGGHVFRSYGDKGAGSVDLHMSIVKSSNVYYYSLANEMGVDLMHDFMKPLGFGQYTGIDIFGEVRGVLPSQDWKRNYYKRAEQKKWYAGETISLGIGQGYNSFTMLQMAGALATVVNNGVKHKPHLVIATQDSSSKQAVPVPKAPAVNLGYRPEHLAAIKRAMVGVTQQGTSTRVFQGAQYLSGGKTGTAQAVGVAQGAKYNASKLEEHQRDHSLYIAFAPAEDPKIALALIVENAGFGAAAAAPIARRVFDYWLLGQYPSEEDIALTRESKSANPVGTPRLASEAAWPPANSPAAAAAAAAMGPAAAGSSQVAAVAPSSMIAAAFAPGVAGTPTSSGAGTIWVPRWRPEAANAPMNPTPATPVKPAKTASVRTNVLGGGAAGRPQRNAGSPDAPAPAPLAITLPPADAPAAAPAPAQ